MRALLQQKVTALHVLLLACLAALAWQTFAIRELKAHHFAALTTVAELTLVAQQCESTVEQCCK